MAESTMLQDSFLSKIKNNGSNVSIFLVNGIKLHGEIVSFDDDVIMLKARVTQMIYKHAISTVVPASPLERDTVGK